MVNTFTKLYPCKARENASNPKANRIEVCIYYAKGGISYWDYEVKPRGYYFRMTPIEEGPNGMTGFIVGSGRGKCILECERQSKSRYQQAKGMIDECWERYRDQILADGYILTDDKPVREFEREVKH